jgi:AmmeMemoRadiSam system protein A
MSVKKKNAGVDLGLSDADKDELLRIAFTVIEKRARGEKVPQFEPISEKLKENAGAFVCLYKRDMLRGCIGNLEGKGDLAKTVRHAAEAAAFGDPRFRPLEADELPYINIEISVLTPLKKVEDPNEIEVGPHGILIEKGFRSGLLLPQVATERNWDRITFLEETCRKSGLSRDTWKDKDTNIYIFSADVFSGA